MMYQTESDVFGDDPWLVIGRHAFTSRLLIGIEQYDSPEIVRDVLHAARADVFITTYDLEHSRSSLLLCDLDAVLDLDRFTWIGTTSFAYSANAAVLTAHRLRDSMGLDVIKLDVRDHTNLPDVDSTIVAAKQLLADGFAVMPFVPPDLGTAMTLQDLGCSAIRLMASPVASYRGIDDTTAMKACLDGLSVPTIVEGGIGSPVDVTRAIEMGATAVLVNTLIARAADPGAMAAAVHHGLLAGGLAVRSRRAERTHDGL